jgi:hypothetical protein
MSEQEDELIRRARESQQETETLREETERELGGDGGDDASEDDGDAE